MCKHIAPEWLSTYIRPCVSTPHWKVSALTSNLILSERHITYNRPCSKAPHRKASALTIWPCTKHHIGKGSALTIRPCTKHCIRKGMHSHLIMEELILPSHLNGPQSQTELPGNWPGASIPRMAVALTYDLLVRMDNTHIWHGRNLIL